MLKKILIVMLTVCLVLTLAACPGRDDAGSDDDHHDDEHHEDEHADTGNPCDDGCVMHSADGDCHCHGACGTVGCACHGSH